MLNLYVLEIKKLSSVFIAYLFVRDIFVTTFLLYGLYTA